MRGTRSLAMVAAALLAVLSAAVVASAATTVTQQQRTTFARAMAGYVRALDATTVSEVVAQMRAEEGHIDPCLGLIKSVYGGGTRNGVAVDMVIGLGVQDTGERWYRSAAFPLDLALPGPGGGGAATWVARVRLAARIDVCAVVKTWATYSRAQLLRSKVYGLLAGYVTPSPLAVIGTRFTRTFADWGFASSAVKRLAGELNRGLARYALLDAAAGRQLVAWLQRQGIYQLMQPQDRAVVRSYY